MSPNLLIHIPARAGSKRVPKKNLRILGGIPMIGHAINAAISSGLTSDIVVNTDCPDICEYVRARNDRIDVYIRSSTLASDTATGDEFTADIIEALRPKTLMMISPVCPLISSRTIRNAYQVYCDSQADTLISCTETRMQTACNQGFINVNPELPMPPSQENSPIQICNWAVTIWSSDLFLSRYKSGGGAYLGNHRILYPIPQLEAYKVSYEDDFQIIQALLNAGSLAASSLKPTYWRPGDSNLTNS